MLIDSHAHLDMEDFDANRDQVIKRARLGGIARIVTIGIDLASSRKAIEIANKNEFIYATVGYHPHNAKEADVGDLDGEDVEGEAGGELLVGEAHGRAAPLEAQLEARSAPRPAARRRGRGGLFHLRHWSRNSTGGPGGSRNPEHGASREAGGR